MTTQIRTANRRVEWDADCVAAQLTPSGRGAVAVIAVEGTRATERVARHFVAAAGKPLGSLPLDRIIFGRWLQAGGGGECGEEIVVCRTAETSLEVSCHGGLAAARAIMNQLVADGAVEQSPQDWALRHAGESIEAEATLALAEARTERTAAILLDQLRGALRLSIEAAIKDLQHGDLQTAERRLATLRKRGDVGLHLTRPWRVAFAGPPNVGKSSLMNRLLGYQRSIVFDQPGTTRDLLSAPATFEGWSMELTDTAGLRESEDAIELEGVSRATSFLAQADLTVLIFDATCEWAARHEKLCAENPNALRVMNKCDLRDVSAAAPEFLATSALTGSGIPGLIQQIVKRIVRCELAPGDAVPFTHRQMQILESARRAVNEARTSDAVEALGTFW